LEFRHSNKENQNISNRIPSTNFDIYEREYIERKVKKTLTEDELSGRFGSLLNLSTERDHKIKQHQVSKPKAVHRHTNSFGMQKEQVFNEELKEARGSLH
jgi:hypothetical protein